MKTEEEIIEIFKTGYAWLGTDRSSATIFEMGFRKAESPLLAEIEKLKAELQRLKDGVKGMQISTAFDKYGEYGECNTFYLKSDIDKLFKEQSKGDE